MNRASKVGVKFADKYLGQEDNITMNVQDSRYRYYQWLREWYGMGKKEDTNKCPFYQFMFWGSMLMLISIVPIIIMKLIEVFILKPLSWVIPKTIDEINEQIDKSKMIASWIITAILLMLGLVINGIFSGNVLAWFGFVVHVIFSIPVAIVILLWLGFAWIFTEAIPWLFDGFIWLFSIIFESLWTFFILLFEIPWITIGFWFICGLGIMLATTIVIFLCFRIGILLFNSSFTKWIIKKSCIVRESQIERKKARKERIREARQEKLEARYKWEKEHQEEVEKREELKREERAKKREDRNMWKEFFSGTLRNIWKGLVIFPGSIFIAIWLVLKCSGIGIGFGAKAIGWVLEKIGGVFIVVWSLLTETVSNHCPPIDFVISVMDTGMLVKYRDNEHIFKCDNEDKTILITSDKLPKGFRLSKVKKGKHGFIRCTYCTKELNHWQSRYKYSDYSDLKNPVKVYEIQKLAYDPPKLRKRP
jgi:hypothetical protein